MLLIEKLVLLTFQLKASKPLRLLLVEDYVASLLLTSSSKREHTTPLKGIAAGITNNSIWYAVYVVNPVFQVVSKTAA